MRSSFISLPIILIPLAFASSSTHAPPDPSLPWDTFGFGLNDVRTDYMWRDQVQASTSDETSCAYSRSTEDCLVPLSPLSLHPASTILNYGQSLFEGLKAFRRADGSIALFRPEKNAQRMMNGANRLLMPPVDQGTFVAAADAVVRSNARFAPPGLSLIFEKVSTNDAAAFAALAKDTGPAHSSSTFGAAVGRSFERSMCCHLFVSARTAQLGDKSDGQSMYLHCGDGSRAYNEIKSHAFLGKVDKTARMNARDIAE